MSNRNNEYGSRVPKDFGGNGFPGVADLHGSDGASGIEFYDCYWYYPKETRQASD